MRGNPFQRNFGIGKSPVKQGVEPHPREEQRTREDIMEDYRAGRDEARQMKKDAKAYKKDIKRQAKDEIREQRREMKRDKRQDREDRREGSPYQKHNRNHMEDANYQDEERKSPMNKNGDYEKIKKTVGKVKDVLTGDIAKTGAALGMPSLGVAGQIGKEIYEKVTGKGKEGSSISTSAKKAQKKTVKSKSKGKKLEMGISPVGVTRPKKELKKMEGKKATTISTPKTEKSMVKKENLMNKQIKLDQAKNRKKRRKR